MISVWNFVCAWGVVSPPRVDDALLPRRLGAFSARMKAFLFRRWHRNVFADWGSGTRKSHAGSLYEESI